MSQPLSPVLVTFLSRFKQHREAQTISRFSRLQGLLQRFSAALPQLQADERAYVRQHAPEFNVFRVLRLGRREVRAHTPMLGELLNPSGHHGQGTLFLEAFFEVAAEHGLQPPVGSVLPAQWKVRTEVFCGCFGNIDLILSCVALGYLLVIENKVDAQEADRQLERYHGWMETQCHHFPHRQLAFLTPTGRLAVTDAGFLYIRLSYHEAIRDWMRGVQEKVQAAAVRSLIAQYLETVESL